MLVHRTIDSLLRCYVTPHSGHCNCGKIGALHGPRPFKCNYMHCRQRRLGFETLQARASHEKHHGRPWKCNVLTCEYANGGFLSRKMRNDHLDQYHQAQDSSVAQVALSRTSPDEALPQLLDLVHADDVASMGALLSACASLADPALRTLLEEVVSFGSAAVLNLLFGCELYGNYLERDISNSKPTRSRYGAILVDCAVLAADSSNSETFKCIVEHNEKKTIWGGRAVDTIYAQKLCTSGKVFAHVMSSDSSELWEVCETCAEKEIEQMTHSSLDYGVLGLPLTESTRTTAKFDVQRRICSVWERMAFKHWQKNHFGLELGDISRSSCSIIIAGCLLRAGATDNFLGRKMGASSPLQLAAQKMSLHAALFMKFLLLRGADPDLKGKAALKDIRDEKGAKGISKHLGISWDELVAQCQRERQEVLARGDLSEAEMVDLFADMATTHKVDENDGDGADQEINALPIVICCYPSIGKFSRGGLKRGL